MPSPGEDDFLDLQGAMNVLAGTSGLSAQACANLIVSAAAGLGSSYLGSPMSTGEEVFPREFCIAAGGGTCATQNLRLRYFTATKTEAITKVQTVAAVAAAATPTLCRIGIYSVASNGNLTLLHSTTNDTALWSSNSTLYEKTLNTTFNKVAGTRYAIGALCVTGATAPTLAGASVSSGVLQGIAPRFAGSVSGQTDLPASVAAGSIANSTNNQWFGLVP